VNRVKKIIKTKKLKLIITNTSSKFFKMQLNIVRSLTVTTLENKYLLTRIV